MLGCIINVMPSVLLFVLYSVFFSFSPKCLTQTLLSLLVHALMNSTLLSSSNPLPPGQQMQISHFLNNNKKIHPVKKGKTRQVRREKGLMCGEGRSWDSNTCLSPSFFRWVRTLWGSFRSATRSGLDTAASWSRCPMTATWPWPRWRSIPSSWWRTWTRALARASATRCPADASPIKQRGTYSNANTGRARYICTDIWI